MFTVKLGRSLPFTLGLFLSFWSYATPIYQLVDGVLVPIDTSPKPLIRSDSFRVSSNQSHSLDILNNESRVEYASVDLIGVSRGIVNWDMASETLSYTPPLGFYGNDNFQYQLVRADGSRSNLADIDIEVVIGKAKKTEFIPSRPLGPNYVWYVDASNSVTVNIESNADAEITMDFVDRETLAVTTDVKYNGPFTLYSDTKIFAKASGTGYDLSEITSIDYVFCPEGTFKEACIGPPPPPTQNAFGWNVANVKVGQPARLTWGFENVASCEEVTLGQQQSQQWPADGLVDYTFHTVGTVTSKWHCKNTNGDHIFPVNGEYLYADLIVEPLDKPQGVTLKRGYDVDSLIAAWSPVAFASGYKVELKTTLASHWSTLNYCSNTLQSNCLMWLGTEKVEFKGMETPKSYQVRVSACTSENCHGTGELSSTITTLLPQSGIVAINDAFSIAQDSSASEMNVTVNDTNPYATDIHPYIVSSARNGSAIIQGGKFYYTPNSGFYGEDSFEYRLSDSSGNMSNIAHVNITVVPNNVPPAISKLSDVSVLEDASTQVVAFTISDQDNELAELHIDVNSSNSLLVALEDIQITGSGDQRELSYLLRSNQNGQTVITVNVNDGNSTSSSSFTVNVSPVNDVPSGDVTVEGILQVGETVSALANIQDDDGLGTFSYQWFKDGVLISGETNSQYVITQADDGVRLSVSISYTDQDGTSETVQSIETSPVGVAVPPVVADNLVLPSEPVLLGSNIEVAFDYAHALRCYVTASGETVVENTSEASGRFSGMVEPLYTAGSQDFSITCVNSGTAMEVSSVVVVSKLGSPKNVSAN